MSSFGWKNARGFPQGYLSVDAMGRIRVEVDDDEYCGVLDRESSVAFARAVLSPGGVPDEPERGEA